MTTLLAFSAALSCTVFQEHAKLLAVVLGKRAGLRISVRDETCLTDPTVWPTSEASGSTLCLCALRVGLPRPRRESRAILSTQPTPSCAMTLLWDSRLSGNVVSSDGHQCHYIIRTTYRANYSRDSQCSTGFASYTNCAAFARFVTQKSYLRHCTVSLSAA